MAALSVADGPARYLGGPGMRFGPPSGVITFAAPQTPVEGDQ